MTQLQEAISGSEDEIRSFCIDEILYTSFENDDISYYVPTRLDYAQTSVSPRRLEANLWVNVIERMNGIKIRVGSYYEDKAMVEGTGDKRVLFGGETDEIAVLYRATAYVDAHDITVTRSSVYISPLAEEP